MFTCRCNFASIVSFTQLPHFDVSRQAAGFVASVGTETGPDADFVAGTVESCSFVDGTSEVGISGELQGGRTGFAPANTKPRRVLTLPSGTLRCLGATAQAFFVSLA